MGETSQKNSSRMPYNWNEQLSSTCNPPSIRHKEIVFMNSMMVKIPYQNKNWLY